jgi:serine/threonine protein phosphatase 1
VPNSAPDFEELFSLRKSFADSLPDTHRQFLEALPYSVRYGQYMFVHAGVHPERPLDAQEPHHLMWMREPFLSSDKDLGAIIVHGHSIRLKPELRVNRIGIDTGAYATGRLTCVVLQDNETRFLST